MKYSITINQLGVYNAGLHEQLDLSDLAIIDYLRDWMTTNNKKTLQIDSTEFIWVNYKHLIENMPILHIKTKSSISARFNKLQKLNLLKLYQKTNHNIYFSFTDYCIEICFLKTQGVRLNEQGVRLNEQGVRLNEQHLLYNQIKESNKKIYAHFSLFWESYPKKKDKEKAFKAFCKINPDERLLQELLSAISLAKTSEEWQKDKGKYIPHPSTWLNGRRWEDEIGEVSGHEHVTSSPFNNSGEAVSYDAAGRVLKVLT